VIPGWAFKRLDKNRRNSSEVSSTIQADIIKLRSKSNRVYGTIGYSEYDGQWKLKTLLPLPKGTKSANIPT
jgi:hypothetical protein